ncbi:SDR family NAD(P)-dependent oxidoreductase [Phormidesmis priestleyi ULC007]|uniref:SDR family NAD(P)-dependent oxidoreductase n=1 Tax=Phormidesmis priestleyi ULC007 TaxID=1920490 RepID=A0A2T1DME5_9CYAN|nr:SDR family oxidoreductase [Phormidesmis priestleyi]PSB21677.1 SDR family NAD(P)-dependent oxidoreductase [Phormidesmis priestleyi ULC007]PZO50800.1 MAG: SDR family NAD(P)-dependent oxidoreductase [Phormidesmis priestleyi]
MAKTVLITGASTGIGLATAKLFQQQGWNVVATMRSPEKTSDLTTLDNTLCLRLDVTEPDSIAQAVTDALEKFSTIDVLVNNAGYALLGAFEACTPEQIERQFATNVFGLMAVTRAVLPHFRERRSGTIINVSSIGGKTAFPLYSLYHSTKWAVEGFSDSLRYELEPFNIRVKIIEPGPIKTDFYGRSTDLATRPGLMAYDAFVAKVLPKLKQVGDSGSPPEVTAEVIYQAAIDSSQRLRYPAGGNAGALLLLRKLLPDQIFSTIVRSSTIG